MVSILDIWKGRLRAAEAVLTTAPDIVSERLVRKTLTSTVDALRGCIDQLELTQRELADVRGSAKALRERFEMVLQCLPIAAITTSQSGDIVVPNPTAALLLNTSIRRLIGKSLLLFLEDRDACLAVLRDLREPGATVRRAMTLRPRERARQQVLSCITRLDEETFQWFLLPGNREA